jgi:aspartyl protease family protein
MRIQDGHGPSSRSLSPQPASQPGSPYRPLFRLLVIGGSVATLVIFAASMTPRHLNGWDEAWLMPTAIIAVLMVSRLVVSTKALTVIGRQMLTVLGLGAALVAGYSYKDDLGGLTDRALATIVPSRGVQVAPGRIQITADDSGQFFIDAKVDGVGIHFLVDTGASGIAISQEDAKHLGFDPKDLRFTAQFSTPNGATRGAPVILNSVEIGSLAETRIRAWINEGNLEVSLLGMSYLNTLGRIEIKGDRMTIER